MARADRSRFACPACRAVFRKGFARCPLDGAVLHEISSDPLEGAVFADRYVIAQCVGEGGMGRVYRATHRHMSRQFAVKVLFGEHAAEQEMQARFAREAEAACRLSHPNVVSVVDFGETERGLFYLVMDWVEGQRLTDIICTEAPLPRDRILDITRQICQGLAHAHEQGLVHRDLKSENIIVSQEPDRELVRIVDFGLAVGIEADSDARLTAEGTVFGTPAYMPPEQACGFKLDGRTDLFSLGVLMYEMLGGALPFSGAPMDIVRQNMEAPPPPIRERVPGLVVDPELEAVSIKLMAKRPQDRYQTAEEVIDVLDALRAAWGMPGTARIRTGPRMSTERVERTRWGLWLGLLLVLALAGGGVTSALWPEVLPWHDPIASMSGHPRSEGEAQAVATGDGIEAGSEGPAVVVASVGTPAPATDAEPGAQAREEIHELAQADAVDGAEGTPAGGSTDEQEVTAEKPRARGSSRRKRRRQAAAVQREDRADRADRARGSDTEAADKPAPDRPRAGEGQDISAAELERLYKSVGDLVDRVARERGGALADSLSEEYFGIPIGTARLNPVLREEAGRKLERLRRRARKALAD